MAEMLENDLIWGIRNIAAAVNQTPRQVHYLLSQGLLPAGQMGTRGNFRPTSPN